MFLVTRGILQLDVFLSLAEGIRGKIQKRSSIPPVITCAAILHRHGLLGPVELLMLGDVDLTSVSTEDLAALVSSVTGCVIICNVSRVGYH